MQFMTANIIVEVDSRSPVDSILDAVLTVSPNRQYLGIARPTTPATTGPVWIPVISISSKKLNSLEAKNIPTK